ncbi:MAG: secondary thiamine-phosphate synthase enzyme YjbQ [Sulfolobaceae archaeon]|jgi:secondary thiamine-phosphate synthase enzyme
MKIYFEDIYISTSKQFELIDITEKVEEAVKKSSIKDGICVIFVAHSTAAIIANEHERGLMEDILTKIKEIVEPSRSWKHNLIDDNAHAHLGSALIGAERVFPVRNGRLVRGTWQNIFLVELDGPRNERHVTIEVLGE